MSVSAPAEKEKMAPEKVLERLAATIQEPKYQTESTYIDGWCLPHICHLCKDTYADFKEAGGRLGVTRYQRKTFAEIILHSVSGEQLSCAMKEIKGIYPYRLNN